MFRSVITRKLRLESLEERALLAVMAGGLESPAPCPAPTEAVTWVVNTLDDPASWDAADNELSLREAVGRAAKGDEILFDASLAGGTITLNGTQLIISNGITIDASEIGGITINANQQNRAVYVSGGSSSAPVELVNLTITGGQGKSGGGIYLSLGTLILTGCTISGNSANYGGGVYNSFGTLTLTGSTVSGNSATSFGGGIYSYYGYLTLNSCSVSGDSAKYGGGLYNFHSTLTLTNSVISDNSASSSDGGGIYNNSGMLTLTNSTVSGNSANRYGGAIYHNNSDISFYNTIIIGNTASDSGNDIYSSSASLYAYNTLSSFGDWTESADCPIYDSSLPLFADASGGDYRLAKYSQAIDIGNNDYVTTETDIAGNPRIANRTVDLGAYEFPATLKTPSITTGNRGIYVSYGANRHLIQWNTIENAAEYELQYTANGTSWTSVKTTGTSAVVTGLSYGPDVTSRVRALGGSTSHIDSGWSETRNFNVCPMDINNDGDISGGDLTLLASAWLAEEGNDEYRYYCDINGDGDISNGDRVYISTNWLSEGGNSNLSYPPAKSADIVFADFASADIEVAFDLF